MSQHIQFVPAVKMISGIPAHPKHDHFWIEDGILYESYMTIRGMRFMEKCAVPGMPDEEQCSQACIEYLAKEYFS